MAQPWKALLFEKATEKSTYNTRISLNANKQFYLRYFQKITIKKLS